MIKEGLSHREGDSQNFSGGSLLYQHTPLTPTPHPLAPPPHGREGKKCSRTFNGKVLNGENAGREGERERDRQREGERESARMEGLHRHFPRLRAVTYNPQCVHRVGGGAQTEQEQARALQAPGKMSRRMLRCN